jgi:hypothetical protein
MKMKKGLALILAAITALGIFAFTACGGDSGISGKYELDSAEASGITITKEDLISYGMDMSMEFKSGGKVTMSLNGEDGYEGTYKVDGDNITITDDTEAVVEGTLSDGGKTITILEPSSGVTMILKKV